MNAYELADELDEDLNCKSDYSAMLRQQADRIAELEKQYKFGVDWGKDDKSVTVLKIHDDGVSEIVFFDYQERPTPQTKPLSDEEIDRIIYSVDWAYDPVGLARAIEERILGK